jgi:large subunit ribosomal protein L24
MRIKKGDEVIVISGKDKGKKGDVLKVVPATRRVLVQGVNMIKKHTRPTAAGPGGIIQKEAFLHVSNVAHVDPKLDKPTRVGYRTLENGRKVRYAKLSGEVIDV